MHLLAASPLKCYTIKAHVAQSSALHRPNPSSFDVAWKEKQRPGQNAPGFVPEPWVSTACSCTGLENTRSLASS